MATHRMLLLSENFSLTAEHQRKRHIHGCSSQPWRDDRIAAEPVGVNETQRTAWSNDGIATEPVGIDERQRTTWSDDSVAAECVGIDKAQSLSVSERWQNRREK